VINTATSHKGPTFWANHCIRRVLSPSARITLLPVSHGKGQIVRSHFPFDLGILAFDERCVGPRAIVLTGNPGHYSGTSGTYIEAAVIILPGFALATKACN
jgi:hypothetical protein